MSDSDGGMNMGPMPTPADSGGSMSNDSMKSMDMHMSFYWGKDVTILFSGWPENHTGMYVLALLFVLLLSAAIEALSKLSAVKPGGTTSFSRALNQTSVHAVRMCFAYMVMLSVMSLNLGIFIAAIAGHAIGFFIVKFPLVESQQQPMSPKSQQHPL